MEKTLIIILTVLCTLCTNTQADIQQSIRDKNHPYLVMSNEDEQDVRNAILTDSTWKQYHSYMIEGADSILVMPVLDRIVVGRRLLDTSRECLRRMLLLGYAYRLTGEEKYARRAESEMSNVGKFIDWNPTHFLDVAEMTTAMAIGYDWLFNFISDETKTLVEQAIEEKGLKPSLKKEYNENWLTNHNNWNQVCNAGITLGALAIYDKTPQLAERIINRAINSIKLPMQVYAPDGAYAEGYSYWAYGTTYNILLIDALLKTIGTDYGLSQMPGFLNTGEFIQNMILSDGKSFNYGDCNNSGRMYPPMFWLAKHSDNRQILLSEKYLLNKADKTELINYRYGLYAIIWGAKVNMDNQNVPAKKMWISSNTKVPVAMMRTCWNFNKGLSMAIKGGTAQTGHAHLDVGSFIIVDNNIRWAIDFGPQDYNSLESQGVNLWDKDQNSQRWKVFRYNNQAHNTLTFNHHYQDVNGYSPITEYSDKSDFMYAIVDMTPVYKDQIAESKRGVAIVDERYYVIRDEIRTLNKPTSVRWNMLTEANPQIIDNHTIQLTQRNRKLIIKVESTAKIKAKMWSTTSPNSYDAQNSNTVFVGFEADLNPDKQETLMVKLIPEGVFDLSREIQSLNKWKNN